MRTNMSVEEFKKLTAEQREEVIFENYVMRAEDLALRVRDFLAGVKYQHDDYKASDYTNRIITAFSGKIYEYKHMTDADVLISILTRVSGGKIEEETISVLREVFKNE